MKGAAAMYYVALLLAVISQAAGKRLGPTVPVNNSRELLLEQHVSASGHDATESPNANENRKDADGNERVVRAELHDFASNPVMMDPVSSKLKPGDLEGTRHVYEKLKKLEDDASDLKGTSKLRKHLEKQLGEGEFLIREHGANNVLRTLEEHSPDCHILAHQVGRAAVRVTNDITFLLEMCESGCKVGCFHGVIMGLVIDSYDGDFNSISKAEKKTYVAGMIRKMCDESTTLGRSLQAQGTCVHGVGHAAVVATGSHDLKEGMEICMEAFYDDRQKQHHCGTGVTMNEKTFIRHHDYFKICSNLPLPASCFDHAFGAAPRKHVCGNTTALITFAKDKSAHCMKLTTVELQEACMYGLGTTVGRTISDDETGNPDMAEVKARMSFAVQEMCVPLKDKAVKKACMLGMLRYANKWFGRTDGRRVICSPSCRNDAEMESCVEHFLMYGGFSYMDHFAIQELPLDNARR